MSNIEASKTCILAALATAGSAIIQALGGWTVMLKVLAAFMVIDYVTGFLVAFLWHRSRKTENGGADSRAGAKGLARKMMILIFVWVGALLDSVTSADFFRDAVCLFYIGNEGLSILENTAVMGVKYPSFVRDALEILHDRGDSGETSTTIPREEKHDSDAE